MYSLCLDCGATNARAMVVDEQGVIAGKASQPNATLPGEENPEFHVWDADRIFKQLSECAVKALEGLDAEQVRAVTVTTFGVDGALVDASGSQLYPVISWKCPRTAEVMKNIGKYISQEELDRISGVGAFAFNTIYKLVWIKENRPELLEKAHAWLFISNLLAYKLTGVMATDRTMAGTSQLTDLETGDFSELILNRLGLRRGLFRSHAVGQKAHFLRLPPQQERPCHEHDEGDAGKHPGRPDDGQAYQRVPGPKPDQDTQRGGEDHPRHTGTSFPPGPSAAGGYVDGTTRPCRSGRRADGYG